MCVTCHKENDDSEAPQIADCQRCHKAQYDMNQGIGAKGIEGEPGLMWAAEIGCEECHTGVGNGMYRPSKETCVNCHEDEYTEIFDEWADETKAEIAELRELRIEVEDALKDADKRKRATQEFWTTYEAGLYNLKLVRNDGTNGVHNREFAAAILDAVRKDFKKIIHDLDANW